MQLLETDWDAPGGATKVPYEYPNTIAEEFLNWLRQTSAWRENQEIVERRVNKLNRDLSAYRNRPRDTAPVPSMVAEPTAADRRAAGLAKARAAKAAKKEALQTA